MAATAALKTASARGSCRRPRRLGPRGAHPMWAACGVTCGRLAARSTPQQQASTRAHLLALLQVLHDALCLEDLRQQGREERGRRRRRRGWSVRGPTVRRGTWAHVGTACGATTPAGTWVQQNRGDCLAGCCRQVPSEQGSPAARGSEPASERRQRPPHNRRSSAGCQGCPSARRTMSNSYARAAVANAAARAASSSAAAAGRPRARRIAGEARLLLALLLPYGWLRLLVA